MPLPEKDISIFLEVTLACLYKTTGNELTLKDPTIEFESLVFSAYTGLIQLKGRAEGFVYFTASQHFLTYLGQAKGRHSGESSRDVIEDLVGTISFAAQKSLGTGLTLSQPRVFSTVPDDPIDMPPAVFVQPMLWRKEYAYLVLGLSSPETPEPTP